MTRALHDHAGASADGNGSRGACSKSVRSRRDARQANSETGRRREKMWTEIIFLHPVPVPYVELYTGQ
jgi:hypothetical protein